MRSFEELWPRLGPRFTAELQAFEAEPKRKHDDIECVLQEILGQPGLLGRLVAELDDRYYATFLRVMRDQLCRESGSRFSQSTCYKVITHLRAYLNDVPLPFAGLASQAANNSRYIDQLLPALEDLEAEYKEIAEARKSPFQEEQRRRQASKLIRDMGHVLTACLDILHDGRLAESIVQYHVESLQTEGCIAIQQQQASQGPSSLTSLIISRKREAVALGIIDGHGSWKVTVSTRFLENLRTSKSHPRLFSKIKGVLQELSQGIFSGRNQLPLTDESDIPIFMAYLSRHCSLVYYIQRDTEIRVVGMYAANTLEDRAFWNALGHEVASRNHGGSTSIQEPASTKSDVGDKLRFMVVLDRYVEFSKPVLQQILDDEEIKVLFEPSDQEDAIIEHGGSCYVLGRSGTGKTTVVLFKMVAIERAWVQFGKDIALKPRQLFLTRSQHLADAVRESFARLHETYVVGDWSEESGNGLAFEAHDDVPRWSVTLPDSYEDLRPEHFPLFVSFDKLCSMLENAFRISSFEATGVRPIRGTQRLLTYDIFSEQYWKRFPRTVTKGLDPFLVYGEIMGVIKGSEETLSSGRRFLSREQYLKLPLRSYQTFAKNRDDLYTVFERYQKRKRHLDIADRTHAILEALRKGKYSFLQTADFVYVDEAQDNLLIDVLIMRSLCKNSNGLLWAGDTAQTIFAGSAFTFNTLRAFLYRQERQEKVSHRSKQDPAFFTLTANFRSRGGIVACSQTILDLISEFWPDSVDYVPREAGLSTESLPCFFHNVGGEDVDLKKLISTFNKKSKFGAEQCILVRDETVRDALRPYFGDSAFVLTPYDSKGLEFDDVLLYNFFADSQYPAADWEVLSYILDHDARASERSTRVAGILVELKFLYVAITRARNRLWIVDNSEKATPVQRIWANKGEVRTETGHIDLAQFMSTSDKSQWERKGRELFAAARFKLASQAFRMAELPHDAAISNAFYLKEQADVVASTGRLRAIALGEAADAFCAVAENDPDMRQQLNYYGIGADCFLEIPAAPKAASTYVLAHEYSRAVEVFRSVAMFDDALKVIDRNPTQVGGCLSEKVIYAAKIQYFRTRRLESALALHTSAPDALRFVEMHGLRSARIKLLLHLSRYDEAAHLALESNHPTDCLRLHLLHDSLHGPHGRVHVHTQTLLGCLWREAVSYTGNAKLADQQPNENVQSLLQLIAIWDEVQGPEEPSEIRDEIRIFKAIFTHDLRLLEQRINMSATPWHHASPMIALLCLARLLSPDSPPASGEGKNQERACEWLHLTLQYVRASRAALRLPRLCDDRSIQRFFSFRPVSLQGYRLLRNGLALQVVSKKHPNLLKRNDAFHILSDSQLSPIIKRYLEELVQSRIADVNRKYPYPYALCTSRETSLQGPQSRLRALCLLVLLDHSLRNFKLAGDHHSDRKRLWLDVICKVLARNDLRLRSTAPVGLRDIPEGKQFAYVLGTWIRDALRQNAAIPPQKQPAFFVQLATIATLLDIGNESLYTRSFGTNMPRDWMLAPAGHWGASSCMKSLLDMAGCRTSPWVLHDEVRSFKRLVQEKFPVDVHVICDFIDYMTTSFAIALRGTSPEGARLPPNSVPLAVRNTHVLGGRESNVVGSWIQTLRDVLEEAFQAKSDGFLYVSGQLLQEPNQYGFVSRICQSLALLGYNVRDAALRGQIVTAMECLRAPGLKIIHRLCRRFSLADTWSQVSAIVSSTNTSTVRLQAKKDAEGDVRYTLSLDSSRVGKRRTEPLHNDKLLSAQDQDAIFTEFALLCALYDKGSVVEWPNIADAEFKFLCASLNEAVSTPADPRPAVKYTIPKVLSGRLVGALSSELPRPRVLQAAQRIQSFLRPRLQHRKPTAHSRLSRLVSCHLRACLKPFWGLSLPRSERRLLLWSLPHALACLDVLRTHFEFEKDVLSRKLQTISHLDLETVGVDVVNTHEHLAEVFELQCALEPQSYLCLRSERHDLSVLELRRHIARVGKLAKDANLEGADDEWKLVLTHMCNLDRVAMIR